MVCGGLIEIQTDPKNTAYVVTEGAKKRDTGEDKDVEGDIDVRTEEERERIRNDAFAALEGKAEDKRKAITDNTRVEELKRKADQDWADPYTESRRLRKAFRADRKVKEKAERVTEALKDKMGLGIDLLPEKEEDKLRAGFVEFGALGSEGDVEKARSRPLFEEPTVTARVEKGDKSLTRHKSKRTSKRSTAALAEANQARRRYQLAKDIRGSSRAVVDPFLITKTKDQAESDSRALSILRGKKAAKATAATKISSRGDAVEGEGALRREPKTMPLVDYDSD